MPRYPLPRPGPAERLGASVRETVGGLPTAFWWLWLSTLVNRLGGFVVTFLALYLTLDRHFSPAFAGLVSGTLAKTTTAQSSVVAASPTNSSR